MNNLLAPREVAQILSVSVPTLTRWRVRDRGPPYVKIGGSVRYPKDALKKYIEENLTHEKI